MNKRMALVVACLIALTVGWFAVPSWFQKRPPLRMGVLLSLTGPFASREAPLQDAYALAVEEINERGGIQGRPVELELRDGASEPAEFQKQAAGLCGGLRVQGLFGCWDGACRRAVQEVVRARRNILFCPSPSEGLDDSEATIFTGPLPNQRVIPAINWLYQQRQMRSFYLIGTNGVYGRVAHLVARDQIKALGGKVIGEDLLSHQQTQPERLAEMMAKVQSTGADVVICSCEGPQAVTCAQDLLAQADPSRRRVPIMFLRLEVHEIPTLACRDLAGHFIACGYVAPGANEPADHFSERFRTRFGADRPISDGAEAAYVSVMLWAQAMGDANSARPSDVLKDIRRQSLAAPGGPLSVDSDNLHAWKVIRIGQLLDDGAIRVLWCSEKPIRPVLFPVYRTREAWTVMKESFFRKIHFPGPNED